MIQEEALDILKMGANVYLTGSAGSGKTFLLNKYIDFLKKEKVSVGITASTGIAATHLGGMTIHSWSGIGIKDTLSDKDLLALAKKSQLKRRLEKTKVLIIDEVSMLHSFRLDLVDRVCKMFKNSAHPFGGMQVILCGDFFQLPPISRDNTKADFIHTSRAWDDMNLRICYLTQQFRHKDTTLTKILDDIRNNNTGEHTLIPLRTRYQKNPKTYDTPTKLYAHNRQVEAINEKELKKLEGKEEIYTMQSHGNAKLTESLQKSCLAPEILTLKKGAVVMFVKNNYEKGYVNGTLGTIVDFDIVGAPIIQTTQKKITADYEYWRIEEEGKTKAEIRQIPLRLAWAITIHKSQGMTLDAAEIDLSKAFEKGMGYVALSRVRSLDGLKLMGLNDIALMVNETASALDKDLLQKSEKDTKNVQQIPQEEKEKKQLEFLRSITPKIKDLPISTYEKTKLLIEKKMSIKDIANERTMTEGTIIGHIEKLLAGEKDIDIAYAQEQFPKDRLEKIKEVFKKIGDTKLTPAKNKLGAKFSYEEIRHARLFLETKLQKSNNVPMPDTGTLDDKQKSYSIEEARKEHKSAYKKWTDAEDWALESAHKSGETIKDLAKRFNRKEGAIHSRLKKLKENKEKNS